MVNLLRASLNQSTGENLWKHIWAKDLQAGLIVAVVSLPLSLSLALASGFPPFAGLVSSIIGGCILSFVSGSETAIKGPASGLGAITLSSVYMLGAGNLGEGYAYTLAAIVLAGVLQILSAVLRMGNLGYFFPSAVVHGMLASLGFIMFVKQIPTLLGVSVDISSTLDIIGQVPTLVTNANPKVAILGIGALAVILLYSYFFHNLSKIIPPIIPTLVLGIPVALSMGMHTDHGYFFIDTYYINHANELLVQFPADFMSSLQSPNFSKVNEGLFWFFVLMFFMACNIESILTCKVVDQLDKQHRQTQFNKDLIALGIGNIICGMVGGLPIISESKRSIVSLNVGAKSIAANFLHAIILGLMILVLWPVIGFFPICILAAYLIYMGLKMTLPKEFSKSYEIGKEQLLVFMVVFCLTIKFNFLVGVLSGVFAEFIINLRPGINFAGFFRANMTVTQIDAHHYLIKMTGPAIFSNFIWVKKRLDQIPQASHLVIDFVDAIVVDHSFMENLSHYDSGRKQMGGQVELTGFQYHTQVSKHPLATRRIIQNEATARQKALEQYAIESGMTFDAYKSELTSKFEIFNLFPHVKLLQQENTLYCKIEQLQFEFNDLTFEAHHQVGTQTHHITLLRLGCLDGDIPDFILQQEGFNEGIFNTSHTVDVNFDEYPVFSYYYYLTGQDTEAVRKFFNDPELIQFFEKHKGFHLSVHKGQILIYKRVDLLPTDEMEKMISFALELSSALSARLQENGTTSYPYLF